MRYSHPLKSIRQRKHLLTASILVTAVVAVVVATLGFTVLDASAFFGGFVVSLYRVTIAYLISLVLATTLALAIGTSAKTESLLLPLFDVLQSFPSFAMFPLLVVWLGHTSGVTIVILVIAMIWPILFAVLAAKKQLRSDLTEAAYIFGARKQKYLIHILFPLMLPAIVTGSIVAWGEAWETIIAAEIIVNLPGVGTYLAQINKTSVLVVGITLLLGILFILNNYVWLPLLNYSTKYQND